jgi:threonine dehydrogenase-like Zn-dependent dehydrogenase
VRALVLTGPRRGEVRDVPDPVPGAGDVVIDVARVGLCGTDTEFYSGEMAYLEQGHSRYPMILGHEWCGTVTQVGADVPGSWLGRRVTGDTMLGCGRCRRCLHGRHHVCEERSEIGIRGSYPGALAERLRAPVTSLLALPDVVGDTAGAMVEPGGNALRALEAVDVVDGEDLLVVGTGAIGLLVAQFACSRGVRVHLAGLPGRSLDFAASVGVGTTSTLDDLPDLAFDGVVDASNGATVPARAVQLVEPGRRIALIGLAGTASLVDTRETVLKDVAIVGILGASAGLAGAIAAYESGAVDPTPLVAATVGLGRARDALDGWRPDRAGDAPKIHVDPRVLD